MQGCLPWRTLYSTFVSFTIASYAKQSEKRESMDKPKAGFNSIDEYIATFPPNIQEILQTVRATIKAAVPDATERISYQMPTFYLHGNIVSFAAWKNHI